MQSTQCTDIVRFNVAANPFSMARTEMAVPHGMTVQEMLDYANVPQSNWQLGVHLDLSLIHI